VSIPEIPAALGFPVKTPDTLPLLTIDHGPNPLPWLLPFAHVV
jgi:hypothetical protein